MQLKRSLPTILLVFCLCLTVAAQTIVFEAKVVSVLDGTTVLVVTQNKTEFQVRCHGSIAPESQSQLGPESKQRFSDLLIGRKVSIEYRRRDESGRLIGTVRLDVTDMCLDQIAQGWAWYDVKASPELNSSTQERYNSAESTARNRRLGMWGASSNNTINTSSNDNGGRKQTTTAETSTHNRLTTNGSSSTGTNETSSTGSTVDVSGYLKKDGTYVRPYRRTLPNGSVSDNLSASGNTNPFIQKSGNKNWLRRNWWIFPTVGALVGTGYLINRYGSGGIICNDGWVSHAQNRQGACSHHGGIR